MIETCHGDVVLGAVLDRLLDEFLGESSEGVSRMIFARASSSSGSVGRLQIKTPGAIEQVLVSGSTGPW